MKLWKLILLLIGSYLGMGFIVILIIFGVTGQFHDIFGDSDSFFIWINFLFGHSLASPSLKILSAVNESPGNSVLLILLLLLILPGLISAILVGLFAKNSKVAFRVVFLFFILCSVIILILYASGIYLYSIEMISNVIPGFFALPQGLVIFLIVMIGLFQSIVHGGIAGQLRNILRRKQR